MRILQKILSLLMLVLILAFKQYPCADIFFVTTSNIENFATQENRSTIQTDMCSPLCVCACCAVFHDVIVFNFNFSTIQSPFYYSPTYFNQATQGVNLPIWQPPKIG